MKELINKFKKLNDGYLPQDPQFVKDFHNSDTSLNSAAQINTVFKQTLNWLVAERRYDDVIKVCKKYKKFKN